MSNFIEVLGDLYNSDLEVLCVDKVKYDRYDDNYNVRIYVDGSGRYSNSFDRDFKNKKEADAYRDEFISKVCT